MEELNQAAATTAETQTHTQTQARARDERGRFAAQSNGTEPPRRNPTIRESLEAAFAEQRRKAEPPVEKPAAEKPQAAAQEPTEDELPETEEDAADDPQGRSERSEDEGEVEAASDGHEEEEERQPAAKPQASKSEPPLSWTKQGRAIWDNLPPLAQQEVLKREADTQRGVEKLKEQYRELEEAVAPYKGMIHSMGRTTGAAIKGLFDWQMALAGPNKADAFRQLAANLGVDLKSLVTDEAAQATPQAPGADVPQELKPVLDQYASKISLLDQEVNHWKRTQAEQQQAQANQMIEKWAENKPHFAAVRELMGQLINSELALVQAGRPASGRFIKNGNIDLDAAYEAAIYANPDVRKQILADEAQRKAEEARTKAKLEVSKAKKAGVSVKPNAPTAPQPAFPPRKPGQRESVRDSILRAMAEAQGR